MHNIVKVLVSVALVFALEALYAAVDDIEIKEVDEVIRKYAGGDDDYRETMPAYKAAIWDKGAAVMPILEALFESKRDSHYRTNIVFHIFKVDGGTNEAIAFVEKQLARPSTEWEPSFWISRALREVVKVDPDKARQFAIRVIDQVDEPGIASMALGVLSDVGAASDIAAIREATKGWEAPVRKERENGARGVIAAGRLAIDAIVARPENTAIPNGVAAMAASDPVGGLKVEPSQPREVGKTNGSFSYSRWLIGALVLAVMGGIMFAIKRFF